MDEPLKWVGHRRRGRPKSEKKVHILDTAELLAMFECDEVATCSRTSTHCRSVRT
jgi:hypothetical protein